MKFVLAPLAGFTDAPFRRLCRDGGADLACTEMVSAAAIAHGHAATRQLLDTLPGEGPLACQIFGATESDVACAARFVSSLPVPWAALDLNAGCPMQKVTRAGAGAKLVEDPEKIHRLLVAMAENTPLPVTLKTRLGPHPQQTNIFEILDAAERAGAAGITVHARYTSQLHGGETHLDTLAEVVRRAKIPVTGNGSVRDAASAAAMAATGVRAVMIGRAALANPYIFTELKGAPAERTKDEMFRAHLGYILSYRPELAVLKLRTHLFRYFSGRPGAAALRARLNSVKSLAELAAWTGPNPLDAPTADVI